MPFDFNAPQANPSPAAYGPMDVGITPYLLEMTKTIAQNMRSRRMEQMRQAQMQREAELHRMALEQHGQDIQSRIAEREALYGHNETIPGGTQTVEEPVAPQMPSPETQIGAGLRVSPDALQRTFGALGLGSNLPGPAAPWKTQQVEQQMPDQTIHVPGAYQQRWGNTAEYQNRMAGAAEQNAATRQTLAGQGEEKLGIARSRATAYIQQSRARAAADQQRAPGQITPAIRAAKRAQILEQAMTNPQGMGGLTPDELGLLTSAASARKADLVATASDSRSSPALRAYLQGMLPYAED